MNLKRVRGIAVLVLAAGMAVTLVVVDKTDRSNSSGSTTEAGTVQPVVPTVTPATATPSPTAGERSPEVTPTAATPTATPDPHGEHRQPAEYPIRVAATNYLRLFFDRRMPTETWRARLAALSTPSHGATLATVPRVEVPNVALVSTSVVRLASSAATIAAVLSDRSVMHVGLVLDERGWKVSRVIPYRKVVSQ